MTQQHGEFGDSIQNLCDEIHASELNAQKERLVDAYLYQIHDTYNGLGPTKIPYDQFSVDQDGKTFYWTPDGGRKIRVSALRGISVVVWLSAP